MILVQDNMDTILARWHSNLTRMPFRWTLLSRRYTKRKWYNCPPRWERSYIPPMKDVGIIFLGTLKGDMFVPWRLSTKMFGVHEWFWRGITIYFTAVLCLVTRTRLTECSPVQNRVGFFLSLTRTGASLQPSDRVANESLLRFRCLKHLLHSNNTSKNLR